MSIGDDKGPEPINVIIPIGGIGSRFAKQGYRYPKPLINIVGRPMLLWLIDNLSLTPQDTLWMAVNEDVDDEFRIGQLVAKTFPRIDFRLHRLRHQTKGASETLYVISQSMTKEHLSRRTVSLDCDTIYWGDILADVRRLPQNHGGCFYMIEQGSKPIFSYIKTESKDGLERIVDIREKVAISEKANTGAYVFPSGELLKTWACNSLDQTLGAGLGEFYTSHTIGQMIQGGIPFLGLPVAKKDFTVVGTPEQLQALLKKLSNSSGEEAPLKMKKRRFCFDLDGTLVGYPIVKGDYSTCPPIEKNILLVQQLFKAGHHIIIQTARRMRTHDGNVGSVLADIGPVTFAQLAKYKIPYHDIQFGKPWADVYIDDLAVNANLDTMREIGWLLDQPSDSILGDQQTPPDDSAKKEGMVAARDFNTIQIVGGKVVKSSKSDNILGELYFYSHMPKPIEHVFPSIYSVEYIPETATYSTIMENRQGLTFSHLMVGRSITPGRLGTFLKTLHSIHSTPAAKEPSLSIPQALLDKFAKHSLEDSPTGSVNIYANYGQKLRGRYEKNRELYDRLGPLAEKLYSRLDEFLDTYEAEEKGVYAEVIHGDPVFSNAILSNDGQNVSFIDVRCLQDNYLTSAGDIHYDLAKVLQSLCGYDHILFLVANGGVDNYDAETLAKGTEALLDEADQSLLEELRGHFFEFIENTYDVRIHRKTLYRITASLFFSLIPLHNPALGVVFLKMCEETLDKASSISAESHRRNGNGKRKSG